MDVFGTLADSDLDVGADGVWGTGPRSYSRIAVTFEVAIRLSCTVEHVFSGGVVQLLHGVATQARKR